MKKLVLLAVAAITLFVSCSSPVGGTVENSDVSQNGENNTKPETENKVDAANIKQFEMKNTPVPSSFDEPTWIGLYDNSPNIKGKWMFMLVSKTDTLAWGDIDKQFDNLNEAYSYKRFYEELLTNKQNVNENYPYWCKIDDAFYNAHKDYLPSYVGDKAIYNELTKYEFLKKNSISTLNEEKVTFTKPTWVVLTAYIEQQTDKQQDKKTVIEMKTVKVNGLEVYGVGDLTTEYKTDKLESAKATWKGLFSETEQKDNVVKYWCVIDDATYEAHKAALPSYLKPSAN